MAIGARLRYQGRNDPARHPKVREVAAPAELAARARRRAEQALTQVVCQCYIEGVSHELGVARSHSRPHVSNDNPHSEANFKTLKYCPAFPGRFGSIEDARAFCSAFFDHYNHVHRHAGIGLHTPASVHFGTATAIRTQRALTLCAAYAAKSARFRHRRPLPPKLLTLAGSTSRLPKHS